MCVTYGCEFMVSEKKKRYLITILDATYHCVTAHYELIWYFLLLRVNVLTEMKPSFKAKHNNCGLHYLQHESLASTSPQNFVLLQNCPSESV
jgi:hypothetical protein